MFKAFSIFIAVASLTSIILFVFAYLFQHQVVDTYNSVRPYFLAKGGEDCIQELKDRGAVFISIGDQPDKHCPIYNSVRIKKFQNTELSSPIVMSCPAALRVDKWFEIIKARYIEHMGTVNCRKKRGGGEYSEHSFGIALDVSSINGANVSRDWGGQNEKGDLLKFAAEEACNYFSNVLHPDTDRLHHDHFHVDTGIGLGCFGNGIVRKMFRTARELHRLLI